MRKIITSEDLKMAIQELEWDHKQKSIELRDQFHETYESLKPINVIKSSLKDLKISKEITKDVVNTSIGAATGYLSRVLLSGSTGGPVRKIAGALAYSLITQVLSNNPDPLLNAGKNIYHSMVHKLKTKFKSRKKI